MLKYRLHLSSVEELIFLLGILTALALLQLPCHDIDGNRVPILVFGNKPTLFHAFLVAVNFGFTAAVVTMSIRTKNPTLAQFCRTSAVGCVAVAAGLVSYSSLPPYSLSLNKAVSRE